MIFFQPLDRCREGGPRDAEKNVHPPGQSCHRRTVDAKGGDILIFYILHPGELWMWIVDVKTKRSKEEVSAVQFQLKPKFQVVSFHKLKLTNNISDKHGLVS